MLGILNLNLRSLNITGKKKSLMAVVIFPSTAVLNNHLVPNHKTKIADLRVEIKSCCTIVLKIPYQT